MKSINAIFYYVITFSIFSISCVSVGEKAANIAVQGLEVASQRLSNDLGGASQQLSNVITDAAPRLGADAAKTLGDTGIDMSKNIADGLATGLENGAAKIGVEAVQKVIPVLGAAVCIYELKEIAYIGKDLYQYCYPDEKEKEQIRQAEEEIDIFATKRAFRECLMKNAKGPRNKNDLPVACEECGREFALTAGTAAFQDMAKLFKQAYLGADGLAQPDNKKVKLSDKLAKGLENGVIKIGTDGKQKSQVPLLELMH